MTSEDLKGFGHSLPRVWQRFKDTIADPRLAALDRAIGNVHAFEPLRYPDSLVEKGALFKFEVTRADLDRGRAEDQVPGRPPRYLLALEELDRLVFLLFDVCKRNPKVFLRGNLPDQDRLKYLARANPAWSTAMEK